MTTARKFIRQPTAAQQARAWARACPDADGAHAVRALLREHADHRREFVKLSNVVLEAVATIDELMKQPSTVERGRAIVKVVNALEMANDVARHFSLRAGITGQRRPAR